MREFRDQLIAAQNYKTRKQLREEKQANTLRPGFIYLVKSSTGHYKIGRAKNPDDRRRTFEVKLPFEVELIHTISSQNYSQAERSLHKRFAGKRVNGEWFALTDEDVTYIKSIQSL